MARIVHRPDPPPSEGTPPKTAPKYTPEEIRALLAVGSELSKSQRVIRRARWTVIPTGLLSFGLDYLFGDRANIAIAAFCVSSLVYTAWPLFQKTDWA